jgi:hypothetical protein
VVRGVSPASLIAAIVLICSVATTAAAETPRHPRPTPVRAIAPDLPTLRGAVALATVVAIDPKTDVAEFRIKCGWYLKPKHKVRIGHWKVALRGLSFEFETYPNGPSSGINHPESLKHWVRSAKAFGWSGTLYLSRHDPFLSDGPTTDICAGVLG